MFVAEKLGYVDRFLIAALQPAAAESHTDPAHRRPPFSDHLRYARQLPDLICQYRCLTRLFKP